MIANNASALATITKFELQYTAPCKALIVYMVYKAFSEDKLCAHALTQGKFDYYKNNEIQPFT